MNTTELADPELKMLDQVWPLGRQLILPEKSTVVVAGCYKGLYMDYLLTVYQWPQIARIVGFEPQVIAAVEAEKRMTKYHVQSRPHPQIEIYPSGLLHEDRPSIWMNNWGTDGATLFKGGGVSGEARMDEIKHMFDAIQLFGIDLFVMNMEGSETILIPHMHKTGLLKRIGSMAIQFHMVDEPHSPVLGMLTEHFGTMVYNDYPMWTYWRKQ